MTKKNIFTFLIIIIVLILLLFSCFMFFSLPVATQENEVFYKLSVPSGMTMKVVASELQANKIIKSSLVFYIYARLLKPKLKAGIYNVSDAMNIRQIFTLLESGRQEYITTSLSEGLTVSKIAAILESKEICSSVDFENAVKDKNIISEFKIPAESLEGYLFPDTYFLNQGMSGEQVVRLFVSNFFEHIKSNDDFTKLTSQELHDVVILASIIEREYVNPSEAPLIASVFTNRVRHNIGLYSCATVEYILTEIMGEPHPDIITNDDLKIDNPYNTYKWAGLTPGPISNPGMIALFAAVNPPKTDYYYFRLVDPMTGTHHFSTTFDEHIDTGRQFYTKKAAE